MSAWYCRTNCRLQLRALTYADSEEEARDQFLLALAGEGWQSFGAGIVVARAEYFDPWFAKMPKQRRRLCYTGNGVVF